MTARQTAFGILLKIDRSSAYSNLALDSALRKETLSDKDAPLTAALVYTVLERMITIDSNLSLYLRQPLKKLRPEVLTALRLGAAQILFMDKIPVSAAVNESVKLVKDNKCAFASGLVNAVLRKTAQFGAVIPDETDKSYLSVRYSCPDWLVRLWCSAYGRENAESIMESSVGAQKLVIRVNTLKTTSSALLERFAADGIDAEKHDFLPDALVLKNAGAPEKLPEYDEGLFHVQDTASQLCCASLGASSGDTVLDVCAAPGGKAFTLAQMMGDSGEIHAFDIYEKRLGLIESGAARLGISNIHTGCCDASVFNEAVPMADRILCDVPCSGLGVIGKKPEIRYKTPQDIDKLPDLQYVILSTSSRYLKSGGTIVYSTCSLNPAENENVCDRFLSEHSDFTAIKPSGDFKYYDSGSYATLMPHLTGSDGFFIAVFRKTE